MKLVIDISDYNAEWIRNAYSIPQEINTSIAESIINAELYPDWIPVTEKLPEENGCYLVSVKNDHERRYSKTAWFGKNTWFARQDIIAWMPLPESYKGVTT